MKTPVKIDECYTIAIREAKSIEETADASGPESTTGCLYDT